MDHERSHGTLYSLLTMPFRPWTTPGPHTDPPVPRTDRPGSPSHRAVTAMAEPYSQQSRAGTGFRLREPRHATRAQPARSHAPHACWRGTRARQHQLRPPTRALMHLHTHKRRARRGSDTAERAGFEAQGRRQTFLATFRAPICAPYEYPDGQKQRRPPKTDGSVDGGLSNMIHSSSRSV